MALHHSGVAACLLLAIGLAVVMLKNDWQREKVVGSGGCGLKEYTCFLAISKSNTPYAATLKLTLVSLLVLLSLSYDSIWENEYRVSTPMMGGVTSSTISSKLRDGPWPACIGMESSECVSLIESDNSDLKVIVVQDGEYVTEDFRLERVWVFVDEDDLVVKPIPGRG
eukprot:scaffold26379_cov52-Attheya_sp.AAC.3